MYLHQESNSGSESNLVFSKTCYVQHFLSPYIDSEVNHKQHLSKFHSLAEQCSLLICMVFEDNSVISSILNYFNNSESQIIRYKYNKPIRSAIFNFNKIATDINIDSKTPDSWSCWSSNCLCPPAGHMIAVHS